MNNILITGCAGFIGYSISKLFLKKNFKVVGVDNINEYYDPKLKLKRLNSLKNKSFTFLKTDLENKSKIENIFKKYKFDYVIHLAAQAGVRYSLENPYAYFSSNLLGFGNVLELSRKYKIKHLMYASSSSVYGLNKDTPFSEKDKVDSPSQVYAATKRSNELMAFSYSNLFNLPTTGIRFFTVYGPWGRPDMSIFLFTKKILENKVINLYDNGNNKRDFTYIDDVVSALFKLAFKKPNKKIPFEIYNIGRGVSLKIKDMIKILEKYLGKKAKVMYSNHKKEDLKITLSNNKKLIKKLKIKKFIDLDKGIKEFVNWYKDNYK
jgi:UDP-glucuronate 4-epimerase